MKKSILLIGIFCYTFSFSQEKQGDIVYKKVKIVLQDTTYKLNKSNSLFYSGIKEYDKDLTKMLELYDYEFTGDTILAKTLKTKIIPKYFSKLVTGQSVSGIGSFASVDIGNADVAFAPQYFLKNGNIAVTKFNGGITEGVSSVFNNSKLNSNIAVEFQYHFAQKVHKIIYDLNVLDEYQKKYNQIKNEWYLQKLNVKLNFYEMECKGKIDSLKFLQSKRAIQIKELLSKIDSIQSIIETKEIKCKKNELKIELLREITTFKKDSIALNELNLKTISKNELVLKNKKIQELQDLEKKLEIKSLALSWFSLFYKLKNDTFRLLDASETYENQVRKTNYLTHYAKVQYNYFSGNTNNAFDGNTFLFSFATTFKYKNNLDSLEKNEITETKTVGSNSTTIRESKKGYIAYSGDYQKGISEFNFDIDFYYYINNNDILGIHLFPKSIFTEKTKPIQNFGVGMILPFKNTKKDKSDLNVELYYNVLDIFNASNSSNPIWQRNDIGLRFAFPFNF